MFLGCKWRSWPPDMEGCCGPALGLGKGPATPHCKNAPYYVKVTQGLEPGQIL